MTKNNIYLYLVEGECEEHMIRTLKNKHICPGKIIKINVLQKEISLAMLRTFKHNTIVILVFDTDTKDGITNLQKNQQRLKNSKNIKEVILIPQVENFEEELERSTSVKSIKDFTKSKSKKDFKRDFLKVKNLQLLLVKHHFDIQKFWSSKTRGLYQNIPNESHKIKLQAKMSNFLF